MKKHRHHKHKHHKYLGRTLNRGHRRRATVGTKTLTRLTSKQPKKKRRNAPHRPPPPRAVRLAIRRLLDTTNHIQARTAELENALEALRNQERAQAVKALLLALRNSPDGDILRLIAAPPPVGQINFGKSIMDALVEAFPISPIRIPGERIPLQKGRIPDTLELDRPLAGEFEQCNAVEVISAGWNYMDQPLLKPVVRPLFAATDPIRPINASGNGMPSETGP